MRFVVGQDYREDYPSSCPPDEQEVFLDNYSINNTTGASSAPVRKTATPKTKANYESFSVTTQFSPSVSIASLLEAGKLVKPVAKNKQVLTFEQFDIASKKWTDAVEVECTTDSEKFPSGGFRDAYHCMLTSKSANLNIGNHWVAKMTSLKKQFVLSLIQI